MQQSGLPGRRDSEGFGRRAQRRLSGNATGTSQQPVNKENKRPLTAVLSEDGASTSGLQQAALSGTSQQPRQSFLSKLTRAEFNSKSGGNLCDTISQQQQPQSVGHNTHNPDTYRAEPSQTKQLTSKSASKEKNGDHDKPGEEEKEKEKEEEEDDDDNLVIPAWPSRSDTLGQRKSEFVQHKVYSLKDYSQVSNPSVAPGGAKVSAGSQPISSAGNKLLKSMSQDRKVKSSSKRMSECIYPTGNLLSSLAGDNKTSAGRPSFVTPSTSSSCIAQPAPVCAASASFSAAPGSSLLPGTNRHAVFATGESKIDRMRKLFVSPLSLRSSSSNQHQIKMGSTQQQQQQQARLSFQSMGAGSMLNKPHHMIHAMYRQGGPPGGNLPGSGRSPMRGSKKANLKGFRVYGCPLQMANNIYPITCFGRPDIYKQQSVPYVLARLCNYIEENSSQLTHEGIFRVSGNARLMEKLRTLFDRLGDAPLESESVDVATSASMLKMYLRELPEPLIPTRMNYYFITLAKKYAVYLNSIKEANNFSSSSALKNSSRPSHLSPMATTTTTENSSTTETSGSQQGPLSSSERQRLAFARDLTKLVRKLPIENYNLLKYLACFLYRISLKQQYNKMCAEALGIVFGPNIFRIRSESYKGLKEQELSNQIMASIISNYKSIFDSDLTDPLGNLIRETAVELILPQVSSQTSIPVDVQMNVLKAIESPANSPGMKPEVDSLSQDVPMCRSKECRHHSRLEGEHNEDEEEEEEDEEQSDEEEEEEDDDCDEGESYTPSSGSGSYCSSMDSNTLESSEYDPEANDESFNNNKGRRRVAGSRRQRGGHVRGPNSPSSSDCPSDTSYTPTSSHSDDDESVDYEDEEDDEDDEGEESCEFDDDDSTTDGKQAQKINQEVSPCLRCKSRRESSTQTARDLDDASTQDCDKLEANEETNIPQRGAAMSKRSSSRRKKQPLPLEEGEVEETELDAAEHHATSSVTKQHHHHHNHQGSQHAEQSGTKHRLPTNPNKLGRKFDFFRRRSSSASSLGRIKRARDRLAQAKRRSGAPLDDHSHGRRKIPPGMPPTGSNRNSGHWSNSKISKPSSAITSGSHYGSKSNADSARSSRKSQTKSRQLVGCRIKKPGGGFHDEDVDIVCENVSRLSLSPQRLMQELGLEALAGGGLPTEVDLRQQQQMDALDYEPYFLLRAFNSDETLLRSSYNDEFELDYCAKTPRRFSGHDLLDSKAQQLLKGPSSLEQMNLGGCLAVANSVLLEELAELDSKTEENLEEQKSLPVEHMPVGGLICGQAISSVSLLSQQNTDCRHSGTEVSLNLTSPESTSKPEGDQQDQDVLAVQMRALKSLVKSLRRLHNYGASRGYTVEMSITIARLREFPANSNSYADDYLTCSVDYLSANNSLDLILELLGEVERQSDDGLSRTDLLADAIERDRLDEILSAKIKLLKQRYNDLKSLREHYFRNHSANENVEAPCLSSSSGSALRDSHFIDFHSQELSDQIIQSALNSFLWLLKEAEGERQRIFGKQSQTSSASHSRLSQTPGTLEGTQACKEAVDNRAIPETTKTTTFEGRKDQQAEVRATIEFGGPNSKSSSLSCNQKLSPGCKFGSLCPIEFVFNIEKQLASKRALGDRLVSLNEMTLEQLQNEKLELQKNLLRYEHCFGRPLERSDYSLVGHLYERYRAVKLIKARKLPAEA